MKRRVRVRIRGAVQGVGFRPFVHGLANRLGLAGHVRNDPAGVILELEGADGAVEMFLDELGNSPPPLARIVEVGVEDIEPVGDQAFVIQESIRGGERTVLVPPDMATCPDCLRELRDPANRRSRYPFVNGTNCGPRYTIICDLPYDRARTTMAPFEMCPDCRAEYEDPSNRRFHAEPTCCPVCGPHVQLTEGSGNTVACEDPVTEAVHILEQGGIVAVKGLGGFHLACDASNPEAVRRLRKRKHRDLKPFALMVRDVEDAARICRIPESEEDPLRALLGLERPIVLLDKHGGHGLADEVAPRSASFGVMLPYTPLHHLLLEGRYPALVMTSGNVTSEPIAHTNEDALERLSDIAGRFLLHDRDIHIRTDDSVVRVIAGEPRFLRRSRGYAPFPIRMPVESENSVLAVGAELNNTVCLTRGDEAFLSHHIGDLENLPAYEAFLQAIKHLQDVLAIKPAAVACDLHPGYLSTRYAKECGLPVVPVQHHHAHLASVLAETGRTGRVIGVVFDGLGWGTDDTLWGGEFLVGDLTGFERAGHIETIPQPGGDAAAKRPDRMAYAFLLAAYGESEAETLAERLLEDLGQEDQNVVRQLIDRRVNCPVTSSMGRAFDAASALLGICRENTFHAQAPMELEAFAARAASETGFYTARVDGTDSGMLVVRTTDVVRGLVKDFTTGLTPERCAARFHESVARFTVDICTRIRNNTGPTTVALSGGVFANAVLVDRLVPLLEAAEFETLMNAAVPPGDGGISLGQAAIATARMDAREREGTSHSQ